MKTDKPVKPFTRRQFEQWLEDNHRGWGDDYVADNPDLSVEDAAPDVANAIIDFPDDDNRRAIAYLQSTGVRDLKGCLADYIYDVAFEES